MNSRMVFYSQPKTFTGTSEVNNFNLLNHHCAVIYIIQIVYANANWAKRWMKSLKQIRFNPFATRGEHWIIVSSTLTFELWYGLLTDCQVFNSCDSLCGVLTKVFSEKHLESFWKHLVLCPWIVLMFIPVICALLLLMVVISYLNSTVFLIFMYCCCCCCFYYSVVWFLWMLGVKYWVVTS